MDLSPIDSNNTELSKKIANKGFEIYEKLDDMPVLDHLKMRNDVDFNRILFENESILFSTFVDQVQSKHIKLLNKKRKLVVTSQQVFVTDVKNNTVKARCMLEVFKGITKSLMIGSKNFVFHIRGQTTSEYLSEHRDLLIEYIYWAYFFKFCKPEYDNQKDSKPRLKIFGVSLKSLQNYCTSEKDLMREYRGVAPEKTPTDDFLLDVLQEGMGLNSVDPSMSTKDNMDLSDLEGLDQESDDFFDFVLVDMRNLIKKQDPNRYSELIQSGNIDDPRFQQNNNGPNNDNTNQKTADPSPDTVVNQAPIDKEVLQDFKIKKVLDKGSFGKVFLVVNIKTGQELAMKRINKDILIEKGQILNTKNEKDILFQAKNPFILTMEHVFQNDLRIYFFMEYVKAGNIFDHLCIHKRFPEDQVKFIAAQLLVALGYLHANKVVHRDLKPENVLVDEMGYIRLADFGLAKFLEMGETTKSFCGTPEYLAPEILDMTGHGFPVDWWTLGILIYEMSTGRPPFMHQNNHKLGQLIRGAKIIFPDAERHGIYMSEEQKDIISKLLCRDVEERLGTQSDADEIVDHPWFEDIDWDKLMSKELESPFKPDLNQLQYKKSETVVHTDAAAMQLMGKTGNEREEIVYQIHEEQQEEILISIAQDERNDQIPYNQQQLIEKNQNKFKDFTASKNDK